jgi:ATP-binding cassette subfamily B protein
MMVIFMAAIAVGAVLVALVSASMNKKYHQHSNEYYGILRIFYYYSEILSDYNSGKEVRLFEEEDLIEEHATERFRSDSLRVWSKLGTYQAFASACLALIGAFLGFGIYSIIALKASAGLFEIDQLVKFVGSFLQIIAAVTSISSTMGKMSGISPKLREYYSILERQNKAQGAAPPEAPKSISFKNVSFRYPNTENFALKNVSIDIPVGERIAIVGENGSGKTTFIKLLCGLYDISGGEINLNERNIRDFGIESYHRLFSVIFQDFKIFSLPLAENVACSTDYDAGRMSEVLEKVGFNQRSEKMKDGIASVLYRDCDPDGIEISGGETQKLALARALYKDAPIVILDEPTAALDPFAEQAIYQKFDSLVGDKTVLYISHRLSSCYFCSKIAVFDQGELVQFGTHQELIADPSGKYYALWNAQAQYYV